MGLLGEESRLLAAEREAENEAGGRVVLLWGEARWQWGEAIPAAHLAPLLLSWPSPPSPHLTSLKMF